MCTVPKMVLGTKKHLSDSIFSRITWVSLRDVNSREITFPGRETQLLGLDRDSRFHPSTFYQRDRSWISSGGAKGGRRRSQAGPQHCSRPMPGSHRRLRTIDAAGGGAPQRKMAKPRSMMVSPDIRNWF